MNGISIMKPGGPVVGKSKLPEIPLFRDKSKPPAGWLPLPGPKGNIGGLGKLGASGAGPLKLMQGPLGGGSLLKELGQNVEKPLL